MNDFENFLLGKDWVITITIPNKLLKAHPDQVRSLQFTIQMELEKFNGEIKKLEGGAEKVSMGTPPKEDKIYSDEEKQAIVKMDEDRKKREGGGGRGNL